MWKKLLIAILAFLGTSSIIFAMDRVMNANASTYLAGGEITGRIGALEGGNLKKGDRIITGIKNLKDNTNMTWQVVDNVRSYTDYGCKTTEACNNTQISGQLALAEKSIGSTWYGLTASDFTLNVGSGKYLAESTRSLAYQNYLLPFNQRISKQDREIITYRDLSGIRSYLVIGSGWISAFPSLTNDIGFQDNAFLLSMGNGGSNSFDGSGIGKADLQFTNSYWGQFTYHEGVGKWSVYDNWFITSAGTGGAAFSFAEPKYTATTSTYVYDVRPAIMVKISDIIFGVSKGTSTGMANIHEYELASGYTDIRTAQGEAMKLRIYDASKSIVFTDIQNSKGDSIQKTTVNQPIYLEANANTDDSSGNGINTVSALIFNQNGDFKYYQPLAAATGSKGIYELDTTGLELGNTYQIKLVNESYSESNMSPANCSRLSDAISIEIVDSHTITYTKAPQSGATSGDYEYDKNVDGGQKIGTITYDGKGVAPIHYELTSFDSTDTSYENFEIAGLSAGTSSAASLDVKIKSNAKNLVSSTNSLKAGTYKFCIVSKDTNGIPDTPTYKTKVCVELEVKKTQPTITFESKDKDVEQIEGSITAGVDSIQHATHDNQDIIANGGNDHKISYTQDSGTSGLFNCLPKTMDSGGEITITTVANMDGEIVLKAHIDATDNYLAADTTKTIKVVLGLDATYVEDKTNIKAGSSEAKPSTTVPIGHISVSGGTSPFTYAMKDGANQNGSFKLDTSTGKIYVDTSVGASGLTPGEYTIEVEVTDSTSPTKQKKTVTKKITIQEADLEGVAFEDPDTAGTQAGSTITRTYDPKNDGGTFRTKLMETTIGSLTGTTITYLVDPASNAVLEYTKKEGEYAYFKVKKGSNASEKGTILIKANVSGGAYGATGKDITIPVNVDPYTQEIEFEQDDPYSIANTASCTSIPATKKSTYWNQDDASNKITYTSSDQNKATIIDGKLCPVKDATGTITLTATLAGDDSYKEAKSTITINLMPELEGAYIEDKQTIIAGSKEAKPSTTTKIGHFTATGGTSGYTYAKKTGDNDNDKFDIKANGDVFVSTGAGANGLLPGDYTIEVEITDSTTPTTQTTTFKKTITIKPATLSVKFEDPDDSSKTVENVITRTYDPSTTPAGGSFHTRLVETEKDALTGAKITYSVEADPNDVLEYVDRSGDYANFKVKKASSAAEKNQIKIKATVSGGYYGSEGTDITILVNVEQYKQEIEFKQTNPYPLPNTSESIAISATKKSTYWNQSTTNEIKYTSSDITKATIDADGKVRPVKGATGSITLTAELAGDDNYTKASTTIKINLLGELTLTYTEDEPIKQAVNPDKTVDIGNAKDGAEFGSISVTGGLDKRYDIQIKNDDYAYPYFELATIDGNERASTLKLKSGVSITADILKAGIDAGVIEQDSTNKDQYNWTIQVLPDTEEEPQEIIVHIIGADPVLSFEKEVNNEISVVYKKDGTVDFSVKRGNTVLSTGIRIEGTTGYLAFIDSLANLTTDAQVNGIKIKKANCDNEDKVIAGKSIKVTPKAEASDGYKSGTGTATPIIIKKAEHPEVDFVDPDTILQSGVSSVDKGITGIEPNDAHLTITPKDPSTWEGTTFEKIDSNHDVEPSVTIKPNGYEGSVVYIVNGGGTDNYKPIVNKEIDLFFSSTGGITYKPIKITYGDDTNKVIDYITDGDKETNSYTYAPVEGTTYEDEEGNEILTLDDTTSLITTKQVGKTKVNVTRTESDGNILTQAIPVEVIPKEIILTYESNTIYTGEALPTPAFQEPEAGILVGSDTIADFPIPNEAAHYDGSDALINSETTGTYETKGNWTNDDLATDVNPNYKITIKAGKLTIKKDTAKDNWYHLEDPDGNTVSKTSWHNYLVDVVLDTATGSAGTYNQISNTKTFTDTDKTRFTVTKEDENTEDVYFRIDPDSEVEHKGAVTATQTTVKIDMSDPLITSITGYPVNGNGLSELINNLTFGMFFKPGVDVTIETKDPQPSGETGREVSGVNTVSYKIYKLGEKGEFDSTQTPKSDEGKADAFGKVSFKINEIGNYRICAIVKDNATNTSKESCSDVNVKKIDEDIDGDGEPDFNDSDNDGCPDLNIVLGEDAEGNKIKLNVAEKGKSYPYMNIDSNGDGKPDLNIDTDNDGRPDLNLVDLSKETHEGGLSAWNPKTCVVVEKLKDYSDPIEYCTGTDAKAVINVDTDGNGVPDINIDTDGDMKADINISDDGKKANRNLVNLHTWVPETNYTKDEFLYDTMSIRPKTNIDTDGDGLPDVNIDLDGDGIPDINIDIDDDWIPDTNIDTTGDGVPDINIDKTGDGIPEENIVVIKEWIPKKNVNGKIPYDTMELTGVPSVEDGGIIIEKPDGGKFLPNTAIKVNDISDTIDKAMKETIDDIAGEQVIKKVYEVEYLINGEPDQPGDKINVKIPVDTTIKNPKVVVEKEDGTYEIVEVKEEGGYYVFQTEYIGKVSIIGDPEEVKVDEPKADPVNPEIKEPEKPSTSVQGNYIRDQADSTGNRTGIGGAYTGDETSLLFYIGGVLLSMYVSLLVYKKIRL